LWDAEITADLFELAAIVVTVNVAVNSPVRTTTD
jgi:hypothetical protein